MGKNGLPKPSPAWQHFIEKRKLDQILVSEEVARSWIRCTKYGVDPYSLNDRDILNEKALRERIQREKQLMEIAAPVMQDLYGLIKGSGFVVLLTDSQGYILESLGDPDFVAKAQKILLMVGANWSEAARGTNAIGTSLAARRPLKIVGSEHYCRENHILTCSATPIWGPDGRILGVLDVSGDYHQASPHTLAMVASAASLIQNRLILHDTSKKLILACRQVSAMMDSASEGYICVDENGLITHINYYIARLLGFSPEECIGKPLSLILGKDNCAADILDRHGHLERVLQKTASRLGLTLTLRSIRDDRGRWFGAVAVLKEKVERAERGGKSVQVSRSGSFSLYTFADIVGRSQGMLEAHRLAEMAARTESTVLLQGETGTGKEIFAQAIHQASARCYGPFIAINCGALPRTLIESELFGYEGGSFTGARRGGSPGKFELANNGTIFLDEIGEMPLEVQASLLRVLDEHRIMRVGGQKTISVNIRVIAATNRDLGREVEKGTFRADLFYRLNVFNIKIPSLREREDDLFELADHFLRIMNVRLGKRIDRLAPEVEALLSNYSWPGNVRELRNVIERAASVARGTTITLDDLPEYLRKEQTPVMAEYESCPEFNLREREKQAILSAVKRFEGNLSQVARALGIGRSTLYRKIKEYDLKL